MLIYPINFGVIFPDLKQCARMNKPPLWCIAGGGEGTVCMRSLQSSKTRSSTETTYRTPYKNVPCVNICHIDQSDFVVSGADVVRLPVN